MFFSSVSEAGSLSPSASPAATSYTLSDIYTRLFTNASATLGNHDFAPSASPASSLYTLTQIYDAIPTIAANTVKLGTTYLGIAGSLLPNGGDAGVGDVLAGKTAHLTGDWNLDTGTMPNIGAQTITPGTSNTTITAGYHNGAGYAEGDADLTAANIKNGTTIFGVTGTLLGSMWNGTSGAYTGGSQANGGADDYNNAGAAASGRYATGWTACNSGNNYCGTGDSGADAKDDVTGLIWSLPCNGVGCTSFSDSSPLTYSWDNSHGNNNSRTASQLCSDHSGWYLPHQKQLMMAYIDGSYGNMEAVVNRMYWSASTVSYNTAAAWYLSLSYGYTYANGKTVQVYLRCVRPAI